jgi:4-amino-4-deoxy-L-arabinose transferase-like glycosyltransferase
MINARIMATVFGVFEAASFVILVVAVIGVVPVALYHKKTPTWFITAYACFFIAAFATNFENVLLGDLLNGVEHVFGNLGAGISLAVAAYLYRKNNIKGDDETSVDAEGEV